MNGLFFVSQPITSQREWSWGIELRLLEVLHNHACSHTADGSFCTKEGSTFFKQSFMKKLQHSADRSSILSLCLHHWPIGRWNRMRMAQRIQDAVQDTGILYSNLNIDCIVVVHYFKSFVKKKNINVGRFKFSVV